MKLRPTQARWLLSLLLFLPFKATLADDGGVERGDKARAHWAYLISGWRAEREKLRSFDLRIEGFEQNYKRRVSGLTGELVDPTLRNVIDLRFVRDMSGSKRKNIIRWDNAFPSNGTWIATDQYVALFAKNETPTISLIMPNDKRLDFAFNFEPEAVGFLGVVDLQKGNYDHQLDLVERVVLKNFTLQSLTSLSQGRYQATLDLASTGGDATYREVVIINENRAIRSRSGSIIRSRNHTRRFPHLMMKSRPNGPALRISGCLPGSGRFVGPFVSPPTSSLIGWRSTRPSPSLSLHWIRWVLPRGRSSATSVRGGTWR